MTPPLPVSEVTFSRFLVSGPSILWDSPHPREDDDPAEGGGEGEAVVELLHLELDGSQVECDLPVKLPVKGAVRPVRVVHFGNLRGQGTLCLICSSDQSIRIGYAVEFASLGYTGGTSAAVLRPQIQCYIRVYGNVWECRV